MTSRLFTSIAPIHIAGCAALLLSVGAFAQLTERSGEQPKSIVSLAPIPRPEGALLARHAGDATFPHAPANYHVFAAATAGEDAGAEMLTVNFAGPTQMMRIQSTSKDFVLEGGTCLEGESFAKGDSCSLLVRFNPQGPGHRLGFISIENSADATPAQVGLLGNGYAPAITFVPAATTTVAPTYISPNGVLKGVTSLAVDGGDVLYIADTGNTLLREINSTGVMKSTAPGFGSDTPASVAVDTAGIAYTANVSGDDYYFAYYFPWAEQTAYLNSYAAGTCTPSTPCGLGTVGLGSPANVSMDNNDNLFVEEATKGAAQMSVSAVSGGSETINLWYLTDEFAYSPGPGPSSFAVDFNDNIYTSYASGFTSACIIFGESDYEAEYAPSSNRVAGSEGCGFAGDGGQARDAEISTSIGQIAFDAAGDLYFSDAGNQRVRRINANTGIITTVAGIGTNGFVLSPGYRSTLVPLSNPTGLAVDSQGQIYIVTEAPAGSATQVIQKVGTTGYVVFPNTVDGVTSAAQIATVTNVGNSDMTLTNYAFTGTNPGDFSVDPKTTSCLLTAGSTLTPGGTCQIGVLFKPAATGSRSANLVLLDNTVNNSNTILLQGTGAASAAVFSPASISFPSTMVNQSATRSVTVTNAGTANLTVSSIAIGGTNSTLFTSTSTCGGKEIAPKATCTISVTYKPTSVGSDSAVVNLKDNAPGGQHSVPLSGSGAAPAGATGLTPLPTLPTSGRPWSRP